MTVTLSASYTWSSAVTIDGGELTPADVAAYTGGRLAADDPETARLLEAALLAARNDVGWHVSPVYYGVELVRNGPGGCKLRLPTKKIVALVSVVDNGVSLNVDQGATDPPGPDVVIDPEVGWLLWRRHGCWSCKPRGIVVTMDHGFTPTEASDWRQAILSIVDNMSTLRISAATGRSDADLTFKRVDDVEYQWPRTPGAGGPGDDRLGLAQQVLFSAEAILQKYRIRFTVA